MAARSPEQLLFTDLEGHPSQLQDVVANGLDGGYEDRIAGLEELLLAGSPYHRLMASIVLVSWGRPAGFRALIEWASHPGEAPWADDPVTFNRLSGADDAFESLADALNTSFWNDATPELRQMQLGAARALLGIYTECFFGRTLALALVRDRSLPLTLKGAIVDAIQAGLEALTSGGTAGFDIGSQTASLILPLALADDGTAAHLADRLASILTNNARALRELALALGSGTGESTLLSLQGLQGLGIPAATEEVNKALARRQRNR